MVAIISLYHYLDFLKTIHQAKIMMNYLFKDLKYIILLEEESYSTTNYKEFIDRVNFSDEIWTVYIYDEYNDSNSIRIVRPISSHISDIFIRIEENLYHKNKDFLCEFVINFDVKYGHISVTDNKLFSLQYHCGKGFINIYPYENTSLWSQGYHDQKLSSSKKLRLVYPVNFINQNHLNCIIHQKTLQEHIVENHFGKIQALSENMFVWLVEDGKLEKVNDFFGNRDFLISWEKPNGNKLEIKKRIP